MDVQLTVFSLVFATAAFGSAALSWYAWQRRRSPGGRYFALLMAAAAEWALASALENSMTDFSSRVLFATLAYPGVASVAPLWLLFTLDYSRHTRLLRSRWLLLIWIVPAMIMALAFTNEWHGLIWSSITPISDAPDAILAYAMGPATYVNAVYAYSLLMAGSFILLKTAMRSSDRSNPPVATLILGMLISMMTNLLYPTSLNPLPGMDITPLAFVITGLLFTWAIFRQRLFDLVPVARETLIHVMADGVIVLDREGNVAEINPAARAMLGLARDDADADAGYLAGRWPALTGWLQCEADAKGEIETNGPERTAWLDTRVSVLHDSGGKPAGRLVVLRDITERKLAEEDLRRSNDALIASVREKEILLREIHHRVKNNLQIVSSILSLQSNSSGPGRAMALKDSQDRIRSMALIHEKLYQTHDISSVDFAEYVRSLTEYLTRSYMSDTRIDVDIEGVFLGIDTAIPCGLIINELVSNSLKYAFPEGRAGKICIAMAPDGCGYTLVVADDGIGLPPGLDFRSTPSLGLQLVNMLVGQLEGTIELSDGGGTTFKITLDEIRQKENKTRRWGGES